MSIWIEESELPQDVTIAQAVDAAYPEELIEISERLRRGLPVLVVCDKELAPWLYANIRQRLKRHEIKCVYLDGRSTQENEGLSSMGAMIAQLRQYVRGAVEKRVVVLPHLDLLTTSAGGLTAEAREAIPLMYENPEIVWLGFQDPSFPIPTVIENLFPHRYYLAGIRRERLRYLVTQREARKFGKHFNPWALYKYVSGLNPVKLRRLLANLDSEDYPGDPNRAYRRLRTSTLDSSLEVPEVDLERDIGGYAKVKERLRREILDLLERKDQETTGERISAIESLIPKGMIFWGPPGTGKTFFAKAIASSIGAAITIVSGPELKSRWVGESEARIRSIFHRARQSAPSIIVFDELDSFAAPRGTFTGSGVEHSMVNQLLTEMDGFHKEELVFVIGTTNFVEGLDQALLRPGRFEFVLHIPYPDADDRHAILSIYDAKMRLRFTEAALEYAVKRTGEIVPGSLHGDRFSGDHIYALCRTLARTRLREGRSEDAATEVADVERALTEWIERPKMTVQEQQTVATHEAGHAVCAMFCDHAAPIDRISIESDIAGALGFVRYQDPAHRYVVTRGELLDDLCILMGGREAERLLLDDISIGASEDLQRATQIARAIVERFGLGGDDLEVAVYTRVSDGQDRGVPLSEGVLEKLDRRIEEVLTSARDRAAKILREHRDLLVTLRDLLLERKTLDARTIAALRSESRPLG